MQRAYDFMKILLRLSVTLAATRRLVGMNKLTVKQCLHVFSSTHQHIPSFFVQLLYLYFQHEMTENFLERTFILWSKNSLLKSLNIPFHALIVIGRHSENIHKVSEGSLLKKISSLTFQMSLLKWRKMTIFGSGNSMAHLFYLIWKLFF